MDGSAETRTKMLQAQFDVANAQNTRLSEENALLRQKLDRVTNDSRSTSTLNVESRIRAFDLENERDIMFDNLERLKKKYNKLHEAYLEKVKRCAALEDVFKRQKTLTGLVMKSATEQCQNEQKTTLTERLLHREAGNLESKVARLQTALDEAYDIIDELEFELESLEYFELENQRLNKELVSLKAQNREAQTDDDPSVNNEVPLRHGVVDDHAGAATRCYIRHAVASSICESCLNDDDADSASLERAALTHSLIRKAEAESHGMRRELLRCRLQNSQRPKLIHKRH